MQIYGRYDYAELRAAATAPGASQEAIDDLGGWFALYGRDSWTGEYYDADDGTQLFPLYRETSPGSDCWEVAHYSFYRPDDPYNWEEGDL